MLMELVRKDTHQLLWALKNKFNQELLSELLVSNGSNINAYDIVKILHHFIIPLKRNKEPIDLLLSNGADINIWNEE